MGLFGHIEARRGARFVRHIYLDENAPNLVGGSRASFLIEIEDGNPRAFARQLPGRGLSQSGCSARYDGGEMLDLHLVLLELCAVRDQIVMADPSLASPPIVSSSRRPIRQTADRKSTRLNSSH